MKTKGLDKLLQSCFDKGYQELLANIDSSLSCRIPREQARRQENKPVLNQDFKDVLSHLLQADSPEGVQAYDPLELHAEAKLIFIAGTYNSTVVMTEALSYLARYPSTYAKLAREIRQTFASTNDIVSGVQLSSCIYLRAVIDEALRMSDSVISPGMREVQSSGTMLQGHFIPEGLHVGSSPYALHHDPGIYSDPFLFHPERWIVSDKVSVEDVAKAKSAFLPFSAGSRGCPGKRLASQQMSLALARLVFLMDFQAVGQTNDSMVEHNNGPLFQFKARLI